MRLPFNNTSINSYISTNTFKLNLNKNNEYIPLVVLNLFNYEIRSNNSSLYKTAKTYLDVTKMIQSIVPNIDYLHTRINNCISNSQFNSPYMGAIKGNTSEINESRVLFRKVICNSSYYIGFNCILQQNNSNISGVYIRKDKIIEAYLMMLNEMEIPNEWLIMYIDKSFPNKLINLLNHKELIGIKRIELFNTEFTSLISVKEAVKTNTQLYSIGSTIDANLISNSIANKIKQVIKSKYASNS